MKKYMIVAALALVLGTAAYAPPAQATVAPQIIVIPIPPPPTLGQLTARYELAVRKAINPAFIISDAQAAAAGFYATEAASASTVATMWAVNYATQIRNKKVFYQALLNALGTGAEPNYNASSGNPAMPFWQMMGFGSATAAKAARDEFVLGKIGGF